MTSKTSEDDAMITISQSIRVAELEEERDAIIAYVEKKVKARNDWHAVADGAMDLREIEARMNELKGIK